MSWGVDNIDLHIFVHDSSILRIDRDTTLFFLIVGVHDTDIDLLVCSECSWLFEECIDESCLSVVNVGDDGNIAVFHEKKLGENKNRSEYTEKRKKANKNLYFITKYRICQSEILRKI